MQTSWIPFVSHVGIEPSENDTLSLPYVETVHNHIGTMHAAALFALAETQSGYYLQSCFPIQSDRVLPLLRSATLKYKHPATSTVYAKASATEEVLEKFIMQFEKKGRSSIIVTVVLTDDAGSVVMTGAFGWFVQKRET